MSYLIGSWYTHTHTNKRTSTPQPYVCCCLAIKFPGDPSSAQGKTSLTFTYHTNKTYRDRLINSFTERIPFSCLGHLLCLPTPVHVLASHPLCTFHSTCARGMVQCIWGPDAPSFLWQNYILCSYKKIEKKIFNAIEKIQKRITSFYCFAKEILYILLFYD